MQKQTPRKQARSCTARNTSSDNASDSTCKARLQHTGTGAESDADTEDGSEFELLGMLVADVDGAAGNFVYGLLGMPGRRKGVMDIALLAGMDSGQLLNSDDHKKWLQFLHVWQTAGWSLQTLIQVTEELRPWPCGSDLKMADLGVYKQHSSTAALHITATHWSRHMTSSRSSWLCHK